MSRNTRWRTQQRAAIAIKGQYGNDSRRNGDTQDEMDTSEAPITIASISVIDTRDTASTLIQEHNDEFDDDDDDDVPGAFAVSRHRPSSMVSTGWDPTAQMNEERIEEGERSNLPDALWQIVEEPVIPKRERSKRFWLSLLLLITIFAAAIAIIVVMVPKANQSMYDGVEMSGANYTCENMVYQNTTPDPFLQCECFQRISFVGDNVREIYETIKTSEDFVDLLPSDLQVESCTPSNLALMWSAWNLGAVFDIGDASVLEKIRNRFILALLYSSWDGKEWKTQTNWLSNQSECVWHGVGCDDGKIVQLSLSSNNMQGSLDSRLGMLTDLVHLDLSQNILHGSITSDMWAMPSLGVFHALFTAFQSVDK
jgi:hypothetical protein